MNLRSTTETFCQQDELLDIEETILIQKEYSETSATPIRRGGCGGITEYMWQMAGAAVKMLHTAEWAEHGTHLL